MESTVGILIFIVLLLINTFADGSRPANKDLNRMLERTRKLAKQTTLTVEGRLLLLDRDVIRAGTHHDDPEYGATHLLYEYIPDGTSRAIEARHYIDEARAAMPDLVMRVGRPIRVRYSVDDPQTSMLVDI